VSAGFYGPEVWRADATGEWTYWDLWYAAVCVRDHDGDWDALYSAIAAAGQLRRRGQMEPPARPARPP
jgi:hypothetical protein